MHRFLLFIALLACCYTGCIPAPDFHYQKEEPIPHNEWNYSFKPSFKFAITDTTVRYRPFFIIQHTQAYPYNNLWVWVSIKAPGDSVVKKERINVVLAEPTGKWLGRGMGEIYEQRMPLNLNLVKFDKVGDYEVTIEQNMRINPLPEVLHVGFRLEKTGMAAH